MLQEPQLNLYIWLQAEWLSVNKLLEACVQKSLLLVINFYSSGGVLFGDCYR